MSCWRWLLRNKLVTPGTIVIYDDWGAYKAKKCGEFEIGEAMAHIDIQKEFDVQFEDLGRYCIHPDFYIVKIFRVLQYSDIHPHAGAGNIVTF